ncbi:hypothetical protein P9112_014708 [Eukaryota sp. TZLM1-RC]
MCSIVQAIQQQYKQATSDNSDRYILTSKNRQLDIEFPGEEDMTDFFADTTQLNSLSLRQLAISSIGDSSQLNSFLPNVTSLDLSENHLTWDNIVELSQSLPNLTELSLSSNPLFSVPFVPCTFPALTTLVLNNTPLTWEILHEILPCFPSLHSLFLAHCSLPTPGSHLSFPPLSLIDLTGNKITCLDSFSSLNVTTLNLNQNQVTELKLNNNHIQHLYLGDNLIPNLASLSSISLPKLTSLRISSNPFLLAYPRLSVGRAMVIGMISGVEVLNGTKVGELERVDSERFYLSKAVNDLNVEDFDKIHPNYKNLVEKHGDPVSSVSLKRSMTLVPVILKNLDDFECKERTKKLPQSMTVLQLKELICTLFKLGRGNISKLILQFKGKYSQDLDVLDLDTMPLSFYSLTEGDILFSVEEK